MTKSILSFHSIQAWGCIHPIIPITLIWPPVPFGFFLSWRSGWRTVVYRGPGPLKSRTSFQSSTPLLQLRKKPKGTGGQINLIGIIGWMHPQAWIEWKLKIDFVLAVDPFFFFLGSVQHDSYFDLNLCRGVGQMLSFILVRCWPLS